MAWFEKFSLVISGISLARCHSNYSIFIHRAKTGLVILTMYVDGILLTRSDSVTLAEIKEYLKCHFVMKDMAKPKYFFGIEVVYQKHGLLLYQRKYALDLLEKIDLLGVQTW